MSVLAATRSVRPDYLHDAKLARPARSLTLGETALKWYDVAPAEAPIPRHVGELARRGLQDAAESGALALSGDLGFVILHRCGGDFYFLLVSTWVNDNELWETVWAKDGDADPEFHPWPLEGTHRPTFCVWELGVVHHEQQAWSRYLRSERDEAARQVYLLSSYEGAV
jgi:hypothetical protein